MYRDEDLYHEVLPLYERALRIRKRAWENIPPDHHREMREGAYRVAESYGNMGALLMDLGRHGKAGPHLASALEILADEVELAHERNAGTLVNLGRALRAQMDYPTAVSSIESALKIYVNIGRTYSADAARALANVGATYKEWAEDQTLSAPQRAHILDQASGALRGALNGSEQMYGEDYPMTGGILRVLAEVCDVQGDAENGRRYRERAEANRRTNFESEDAESASVLNAYGTALTGQGLYDEARAYLGRALGIREDALGERDFDTSTSLLKLGILLQLRGRGEEARAYLERALTVRSVVCGEGHAATGLVRDNLRRWNNQIS
jgi:tetratricopeptide (TPR) repeat protein